MDTTKTKWMQVKTSDKESVWTKSKDNLEPFPRLFILPCDENAPDFPRRYVVNVNVAAQDIYHEVQYTQTVI